LRLLKRRPVVGRNGVRLEVGQLDFLVNERDVFALIAVRGAILPDDLSSSLTMVMGEGTTCSSGQ
jgi:hypothetical protein